MYECVCVPISIFIFLAIPWKYFVWVKQFFFRIVILKIILNFILFVLVGVACFLKNDFGNFTCSCYSVPNMGRKYSILLHNLQDHTVINKGSLPLS